MSGTEIGRLHDDGLVAGAVSVLSEPVLADAGFDPSATATIAYDHVALLAATSTPTRGCSTGRAPASVALDVLPPRGRDGRPRDDGHPRRRPEMAAFPQRMWVGGRVRETRALVVGESAKRSSRLSAAEPKEGSTGRFWLVTVEHTITQGGELCIEEEQDLVFREPSAAADPGAAADDATRDDWVEDAHRRSRSALPLLGADLQRAPDPLRRAVRAPGSRATPTSSCRVRSPRRSSASSRGSGAADQCARLSFRARVPLFANRSFWLTGSPTETGADLAAVRGDGQTAMTLTATLH